MQISDSWQDPDKFEVALIASPLAKGFKKLMRQVRTAIVKNSMEVPSKIKQSEHMIQQSHSWACIGENHNSKRYMYPNIHGSAIYNTQDRETT